MSTSACTDPDHRQHALPITGLLGGADPGPFPALRQDARPNAHSCQLGAQGLVSRYRNPTVHETRLVRDTERPFGKRELLEVLTAVSLVHHALDNVVTQDQSE